MSPTVIMLIITIVTGPGKRDVDLRIPQPDIATCLREAEDYLNHQKVSDGTQGLGAACFVPKRTEDPT